MPMMPKCFKSGIGGCPVVRRVTPKQIFVGMPFRKKFEDIYEYGIKGSVEDMGYSRWKADEHEHLIDLMCKVCRGIQESEFAIIDLTETSPNVLFELGICYALARNVLIIVQGEDLPTDLKGMEFQKYDSAKDLTKKIPDVVRKVFL